MFHVEQSRAEFAGYIASLGGPYVSRGTRNLNESQKCLVRHNATGTE